MKPGCPGCRKPAGRNRLFCTICWADVPLHARKELEKAQEAMGKHPTSRPVRQSFVDALSKASGFVRWYEQ